jgi:peptidoglycan/xylan/chitin deacetylase (PgdA/CDA1 family)
MSVHASSFVIVSPEAHSVLDRLALGGQGWYTANWWRQAQQGGLLSIECHSWDHVHPLLDEVAQADNVKGDFAAVASFEDCERQVREAADQLALALDGRRPRYFAYPWGQFSDYLARDYLPSQAARHGLRAAFTTAGEPARRGQSRWELPRYVCGHDWRSPEELQAILVEAGRA